MSDAPALDLFRCDRQNATMLRAGCARMWRKANGGEYRVGTWESLHHCRGCSVGAANAGETVVAPGFSELIEDLRRYCCRCRKPALRLIHGELCISCFNRDLEAKKGRNAKGHPPRLMKLLHRETVMVTEGGKPPRIVGRDRVLDAGELMIRIARRATGPIVFERPSRNPFEVAAGIPLVADELRDETYISRSEAAELIGVAVQTLTALLDQPGAPRTKSDGRKLMVEKRAFVAWWKQHGEAAPRSPKPLPMPGPDHIDSKEAAALAGVPIETLYWRMKQPGAPTWEKFGQRVFVKRDVFLAWEHGRAQQNGRAA